MIRNLINVSGADVTLPDFNGLTIEAGDTIDGLMFGEISLRNSAAILDAVLDGSLNVSDGTYIYEKSAAVEVLKGVVDQLTRDGKRIITASDRPKDHYRHYTSAGDDVVNQARGDGEELIFIVPPGETRVINTGFIDDLYLKDGMITYLNAEIGSWVSVDIIAPANVPYPSIFNEGNYDLVDGALVPNASNTGGYFLHTTETIYLKFVNRFNDSRER
jgi:hypothetical protein